MTKPAVQFIVFFKKATYNQNKTYCQNANRLAGSKSCFSLEEAQEFAKTVNEPRIYNYATGKRVALA